MFRLILVGLQVCLYISFAIFGVRSLKIYSSLSFPIVSSNGSTYILLPDDHVSSNDSLLIEDRSVQSEVLPVPSLLRSGFGQNSSQNSNRSKKRIASTASPESTVTLHPFKLESNRRNNWKKVTPNPRNQISNELSNNISKILENLLQGYDQNQRPAENGLKGKHAQSVG